MHATIFALKRAYQATHKYINERLSDYELSSAQLDILIYLCGCEQLEQRRLESVLGVTSATMAKLLISMEKRGLIQRIPNLNDARVKDVMISPKGKNLVDEIRQEQDEALTKQFFEGFSKTEMALLTEWLRRVAQNMGDTSENIFD